MSISIVRPGILRVLLAVVVTVISGVGTVLAAPAPIVLTGADRRPSTSLDGEWASIVDPYFSGLFSLIQSHSVAT